MSWQNQLKGDSLTWLLESETPEVRYLALRDLLDLPASDVDLRTASSAAHKNGPIAMILNEMDPDGYWVQPGPGYNPKYRSSVWSVILLAQLGASVHADKRIPQACKYLLDHALTDGGQFSASGSPSGTADCLQGNLLWALLELGFEDSRLEKAFEWMARTVTGEGLAPLEERHAPLRYYAGKCGPNFACGSNNKLPCAWGGVKVLMGLGKLPRENSSPLIENAILTAANFFLGTDPASAAYPCGFTEKPSQNWWKFGFPVFYVTDILQIVQALLAVGYGSDPRLKASLELIREKQDENGRWLLEYEYTGKTWVNFGVKKQPNKWVTLRALRVLKAFDLEVAR
jgi:hypothetical protein